VKADEAMCLDVKVRAGGVNVDASLGKAISNRRALVMVRMVGDEL
jgi:hypothetical protein